MYREIDGVVREFERGRLSRRELVVKLGALLGVGAVARGQGGGAPTFRATDVNHVALGVADVSRSRAFYERHLGLTLRSDDAPRSVFLGCGPDFLALFRSESPGLDHYCYTVEGYEAGAAVKRLEAAGLTARRRGDRVYFDDPDGIEVQVSAPNR